MQIYRRNEGDGWRWQGSLTFVAKKGNGRKRMRSISGPLRLKDLTGCDQKVSRLHVAVCDTPNVHEVQGRHKLPDQGSSYIITQRLHLIQLQAPQVRTIGRD